MGSKLINNKVLHLVLKKKWYEMEERGEKTEEYRDITTYWRKRLVDSVTLQAKPYTHVCFHCGYTQRVFINRIDSITIGKGYSEWGAPEDRPVFIISHHFESMKVTRKMLADRMLLIYREYVSKKMYNGLCSCYFDACRALFGEIIKSCNLSHLRPRYLRLLPAFVPPSGFVWGFYWWFIKDVEPRIKFCESLCDLYKDDETDLTPIVHGYLDFDLYEDREAYAKKYLECYEKNIPFNPLKYGNK